MYKIFALALIPAFASAHFDMSAGRVSASGHLMAELISDKNGNSRLDAEIAPEIGVFIVEGLETFVRFRLSGPLCVNATASYEAEPLSYGGTLGVRYFVDTNSSWYPYAGFGLGVDAVGSLSARYWSLEVPVGVMYAINDSVAVTLGAEFRAESSFFDHAAPSVFHFPFGILGLKTSF